MTAEDSPTTSPAAETAPPPRAAFAESHWSTWALLGTVGLLALYSVAEVVPTASLPKILEPEDWGEVRLVLGLLNMIALIFAPLYLRTPRGFFSVQWPTWRTVVKEFFVSLPLVFGMWLWLLALSMLAKYCFPAVNTSPPRSPMNSSTDNHFLYPVFVYAFTLAPLFEECFFRGFLFNALRTRLPWMAAMGIASTLFAFVHGYSAFGTFLVAGIGCYLTLVYRWRKTLVTPVYVHALHNLMMGVALMQAPPTFPNGPRLGVHGMPSENGYVVESVVSNSPAAEAGLKAGDVLQQIDEQSASGARELREILQNYKPGMKVHIHLLRGGKDQDVDATLTSWGPPRRKQ